MSDPFEFDIEVFALAARLVAAGAGGDTSAAVAAGVPARDAVRAHMVEVYLGLIDAKEEITEHLHSSREQGR